MACNIVRIDHLIIDEETREPPPVPSLKVTAKWVSVTIIVVKKVKETMIINQGFYCIVRQIITLYITIAIVRSFFRL